VLCLCLVPMEMTFKEDELMARMERTHRLFLIASTVALEAEGEPYKGKLAVAYVIMNRSKEYGKSISDVVFDPYDFSAWNTRGGRATSLDAVSPLMLMDSEKAAASAFYGIEEDPTHGATHYMNVPLTKKIRSDGKLPGWVNAMQKTTVINRHTFYKEKS